MQRNDGLARACRTRDTRRTAVVAFHPLALVGMYEDCPLPASLPNMLTRAVLRLCTGRKTSSISPKMDATTTWKDDG
jgi:hypothetical protein